MLSTGSPTRPLLADHPAPAPSHGLFGFGGTDLSTKPSVITSHVLSYLDPRDLARVAQVSRGWQHMQSADVDWGLACSLHQVVLPPPPAPPNSTLRRLFYDSFASSYRALQRRRERAAWAARLRPLDRFQARLTAFPVTIFLVVCMLVQLFLVAAWLDRHFTAHLVLLLVPSYTFTLVLALHLLVTTFKVAVPRAGKMLPRKSWYDPILFANDGGFLSWAGVVFMTGSLVCWAYFLVGTGVLVDNGPCAGVPGWGFLVALLWASMSPLFLVLLSTAVGALFVGDSDVIPPALALIAQFGAAPLAATLHVFGHNPSVALLCAQAAFVLFLIPGFFSSVRDFRALCFIYLIVGMTLAVPYSLLACRWLGLFSTPYWAVALILVLLFVSSVYILFRLWARLAETDW